VCVLYWAAIVPAVQFDAVKADMAAFQRFVTARIRRSVRTPMYFGVLVLFGVIAGEVLRRLPALQFHVPTAGLVIVLGGLLWWVLSRLYQQAALPVTGGALVGPRRIELDEDGVRQVSDTQDGRSTWAGVLSVHVTTTHLFLMTDRLAGYIIPLRAFPDAAARETFVAWARARAGRTPDAATAERAGRTAQT